jgi:hypothetical protein
MWESDWLLRQIHWHEGAPVLDPPILFYVILLIGLLLAAVTGSATVSGLADLLL